MYPKILILAIACCAMVPLASGQSIPIQITTCNGTCTGFEMDCVVRKTINRCTDVLDTHCDWMIKILDDLIPILHGGLVVTLTIASHLVEPSVCVGLLNLLLTIICLLINITAEWSRGAITNDQYKARIMIWNNVSQFMLSNYSNNRIIFVAIRICITIVIDLYNACIMNMY